MSHATFQIAYDGPEMAGHSMDVQQLGPALLAVGDLCRETSRVINGEGAAEVNVRVRANFEEACFDIVFDITQLYREVTELIQDKDIANAKQLLEWIGLIGGPTIGVGGGLFGFLKWKRGRTIKNVERKVSADEGIAYNITIEGDHNTVEISSQVYGLFRSPRVRAAQRGVVAPLKEEGIDFVEIREHAQPIIRLTKEEYEAGSFEIIESEIEPEEPLEEQTFEVVLVIRAPVFAKDAKWQFWLGDNRISAAITDSAFNHKVFVLGERFGVGDRLHVKLSLTQVLTAKGNYRNDYAILDVVEIMRGPTQSDFFAPNNEDE